MMIMANEDHHHEHCDDQRDDQATTSLIFDVEEAISGSRSLTLILGSNLLGKPCTSPAGADRGSDTETVGGQ